MNFMLDTHFIRRQTQPQETIDNSIMSRRPTSQSVASGAGRYRTSRSNADRPAAGRTTAAERARPRTVRMYGREVTVESPPRRGCEACTSPERHSHGSPKRRNTAALEQLQAIDNMMDALKDKMAEMESAEAMASELQDIKVELEGERAARQRLLSALNEQEDACEDLERELADTLSLRAAALRDLEELRSQITDSQGQVKAHESATDTQYQLRVKAELELQLAREQADEAVTTVLQLQKNVSDMEEALGHANTKINELNASRRGCKAEWERLSQHREVVVAKQTKAYIDEIEALKAQIKAHGKDAAHSRMLHQQRQRDLTAARAEEREQADAEIESMYNTLNEEREIHKETQRQLAAARQQLASQSLKREAHDDQVRALSMEIAELKENLKASESGIGPRIAHERQERLRAEERCVRLEKAARLARQAEGAALGKLRTAEDAAAALRLRIAATTQSKQQQPHGGVSSIMNGSKSKSRASAASARGSGASSRRAGGGGGGEEEPSSYDKLVDALDRIDADHNTTNDIGVTHRGGGDGDGGGEASTDGTPSRVASALAMRDSTRAMREQIDAAAESVLANRSPSYQRSMTAGNGSGVSPFRHESPSSNISSPFARSPYLQANDSADRREKRGSIRSERPSNHSTRSASRSNGVYGYIGDDAGDKGDYGIPITRSAWDINADDNHDDDHNDNQRLDSDHVFA